MTTTVEQKRRELFHEWADSIGLPHSMLTCGEWAVFNAALDAVVIELPETYQCGDEQYHSWPGMCADEVRAAIQSAGLGLRGLP
jgi:hypothetical protein